MAQWVGQESGNTHDTRVQDAECALAYAVDVIRSAPSPKDQKALKSVVRLAERVLSARTRRLKAQLSELQRSYVRSREEEQTLKTMASFQAKLGDLQSSGVAGILAEFGVGDLTFVPKGKVPGE